jgi:hypothetical protein
MKKIEIEMMKQKIKELEDKLNVQIEQQKAIAKHLNIERFVYQPSHYTILASAPKENKGAIRD